MHSPTPGITKVGHLSRTYTELAGRTTPTATDVEAALSDCKLNIQGLEEYAKRPERRHVQKREGAPTPPPPPPLPFPFPFPLHSLKPTLCFFAASCVLPAYSSELVSGEL